MDILVITWNFPPRHGGMERLIGSLCDGLRKNHRLFVITSYAGRPSPGKSRILRPSLPGLLAFFFYALWKAALLLRRHRDIRVVFGGSVLVTPVVLLLARLFGRRAVVQTHGLDLVYPNRLYQLLCVRWLKFCDRVIANSAYTASLASQKSAAQGRIIVIPPGVHLEAFARPVNVTAVKKEFGLSEKTILFVGRLARRKGIKEFIQNSLATIVRQVPEVCFVVVGDNPNESLTHRHDVLSDLQTVISEMTVQDHVKLLGALDDDKVIKLYQACDVVILPSLPTAEDVEGFGIVLLEAAAAAKPVVTTRTGGVSDAIEDGASGILVAPGDYELMSRSIIELLSNEKTSSGIGEYARRRVKEKFCWSLIIPCYEKALF
jgi:phosphatidylinositol alpha-1,6-mannosyltransferase